MKQSNTPQFSPSSLLPNHFCCITGVDFVCHYSLYATFDHWIQSILLLLLSLVQFYQLKHIFLFFRQDLSAISPLDPFIVSLHTMCSTWNIYQHAFVTNKLGDYVSCWRSYIYIPPYPSPSPSLFSTSSTPVFPNPSCWISLIFKTLPFSLFLAKNILQFYQLKHIFLFFRQDLSAISPLDPFIVSLHTMCSTWNIYQHAFVTNKLGDYVSCWRSYIYIPPYPSPSPSLFSTSSTPVFPNPSCWISLIFKTLPFSLFLAKNILPLQSSLSTNTSFHEPKVLAFAHYNTSASFNFTHVIVNPSHPVTMYWILDWWSVWFSLKLSIKYWYLSTWWSIKRRSFWRSTIKWKCDIARIQCYFGHTLYYCFWWS